MTTPKLISAVRAIPDWDAKAQFIKKNINKNKENLAFVYYCQGLLDGFASGLFRSKELLKELLNEEIKDYHKQVVG